jgi:hypothetical protein
MLGGPKKKKGLKGKPAWKNTKAKGKYPARSTPPFAGKKKPFSFPKPSVSMLSGNDEQTDDRIFVDTCASYEILILRQKSDFSKLRKVEQNIGCAALGATLTVEAVGSIGLEEEVYYCPNSRHNICSQAP